MTPRDYASVIRSSVTMRDVIAAYLPGEKIRNGRLPCPFHGGKDANMSILANKKYTCFVCGERGDVIDFTSKINGENFFDAIKRINNDFSVGLPIGNCAKQNIKEAESRAAVIRKKREDYERRKRAAEREYDDAMFFFARLDMAMIKNVPQSPTEPLNDAYCFAANHIEYARYRLYEAEDRLMEVEKEQSI